MLFKHITIIGITIHTAGMDIITVIDTIGVDITATGDSDRQLGKNSCDAWPDHTLGHSLPMDSAHMWTNARCCSNLVCSWPLLERAIRLAEFFGT
jgi:hypothetical protein